MTRSPQRGHALRRDAHPRFVRGRSGRTGAGTGRWTRSPNVSRRSRIERGQVRRELRRQLRAWTKQRVPGGDRVHLPEAGAADETGWRADAEHLLPPRPALRRDRRSARESMTRFVIFSITMREVEVGDAVALEVGRRVQDSRSRTARRRGPRTRWCSSRSRAPWLIVCASRTTRAPTLRRTGSRDRRGTSARADRRRPA